MTDEINKTKQADIKENLAGMAQVVIGEIESLGGVITGDPVTSAEGDFNIQVGTLHHDSSEALSETKDTNESAAAAGEPPLPPQQPDQTRE